MKPTQTDYIIKHDKLNNVYVCEINNKTITSEFLVDMVKYIGVLYSHEVWHIVELEDYVEDLERIYNINIYFDF